MKPPRFNGVLMSVANGDSAQVLNEEILFLLHKRAIRVVPEQESKQGFYSRYFIIPKKESTSLRPILDLRVLNRYLRKYKFRMLTHKDQHVLVKTDNTTVVAYINRQGGTRSLKLHRLAKKLLLWCSTRFLSVRATHVPGVLNRGADLLSRGNPLYGDWTLHPQVVAQLWQRFRQATVDLFASRENAQCPLYFSLADENAPLGVDALAHQWPNALLYAFPPLSLITPTLARVREQGLSLILIAPYWPSKHWVAEIVQVLAVPPWPLPIRRDLLSQARGEIYHPHPDRLALWAWPVRGGI
ncbi:hypothetical protein ACEWY4_010044 [Coilia grayii]|uniref:Uncharacterized protein n=1 Tax=Coilia grayii TaxID=363190 RepID=A0ABD1K843_9TELE